MCIAFSNQIKIVIYLCYSIRIWDTRIHPSKSCMLAATNAHENDINVIHWNRREPFILSGGDDGKLLVWDLRQFQVSNRPQLMSCVSWRHENYFWPFSFKAGTPVAVFKHHTAPVTSVEWHPTDSTVFASAGADDQIALWDLALEKDEETQDAATDPELSVSTFYLPRLINIRLMNARRLIDLNHITHCLLFYAIN